MQVNIPIKKICQYYGAFALTCMIIDHISPVPAQMIEGWSKKLRERPRPSYQSREGQYDVDYNSFKKQPRAKNTGCDEKRS